MEPQRAKLFMKNPNPMYTLWLDEWLADARFRNDTRRERVLCAALESLRKYPVRLNSAKECLILEGFSSKLIEEIARRESLGVPSNVDSSDGGEWIKQRSPCYAVIVGIFGHLNGRDGSVAKTAIRRICQTYADKNLTPAVLNEAIEQLEASRLLVVEETSSYHLTETGKRRGAVFFGNLNNDQECQRDSTTEGNKQQGAPDMVTLQQQLAVDELLSKRSSTSKGAPAVAYTQSKTTNQEENAATSNLQQYIAMQELIAPSKRSKNDVVYTSPKKRQVDNSVDFPIFHPHSFDTVLLVDTCEKNFLSSVQEFDQFGVQYEVRHLKVGDYAWVARDSGNRELLLPYLVERKRLDDLVKSVMDGRFSDQKFRLQMSAIPNIVFLIELCEIRGNQQIASQAISNMIVKESFTVKETRNNVDALSYLANFTRFLTSSIKSKTLVRCSEYDKDLSLDHDVLLLPEANSFFAGLEKNRTFTTKEMFTKQLVQLHGLSADRAWAIATKYNTPKALYEAFLDSGPSLLANLEYGLLNKKIGAVISNNLHKLYTSRDFH